MKGYVQNIAPKWLHAMKRSVKPGGKIEIGELYTQYGKKHDIAKGEDFVTWLRNVKLRDSSSWRIVIEDEKVEAVRDTKSIELGVIPEEEALINHDATRVDAKKLSVEDILSLSVRKAREVIPGVMDVKLLKYALESAKPLNGKDSLCNILRKRIRELGTV